MNDETERRRAGPPQSPGFEEFRREMHGLVDQFREDCDAAQATAASGAAAIPAPSPGDRIRAFFTFRNVSLALNAVFATIIIVAADLPSYIFPHEVALEIRRATSDRESETVIVSELGSGSEREIIWAHAFEGIVVQATIAPWTKSSWNLKPRYLLVTTLRFGEPGALSLWDVRERDPDKQRIWEHQVPLAEMATMFPAGLVEGIGAWCNGFTFADLDGDAEPEIAALFHHDAYLPACIRTLDRDGSLRGTYWNWGYFDEILSVDVDGDGRDEIVASGTNNAAQGGTVVLLDADHLSGYSMDERLAARLAETELGPELDAPRLREGALARIVFPMWHEDVAAYYNYNRVHAYRLAVIASGPAFHIKIGTSYFSGWRYQRELARGMSQKDLQKDEVWVALVLDASLRPRDLVVPDGLLAELRRAREDGRIDVAADSLAHWRAWMNSYTYSGALASGTTAPLP